METVILGLGNELLGDEGVGVHAVRLLLKERLPEKIRVVEVGTAIIDALPLFEHADRLIIVDAMIDGMVPGTVYRVPLQECSGAKCIASMHGFDIFRTMALAGNTCLSEIIVFGVEPEMIDWSMDLSAPVSGSMGALIEAIKKELSHAGSHVMPVR